ncbi:hypothetical protein RchiOBHm_Chr2g0109821 [Rosa chinensis]|uniref:Uncharacterized protein n=1 Tax=Rosa chinensis TaxID=74649 RepID=A0A2P6RPL0_ROSCH|nr:hypothetical protein RchiOBHm_Chr2g0109821 [Rosa chinensis]
MRSQWKSSAPIQIGLETVAFDYLRSRIRQISVSKYLPTPVGGDTSSTSNQRLSTQR